MELDPEETIIVAHADHDGVAATAGLVETFGHMDVIFSQRAINASVNIPFNKRTVILVDVMGKKEWVLKLLRQGKRVINMDHHNPLHINHPNYVSFNPKLQGEIFVSSSTLVWKLFRPNSVVWALAAGAVTDICAEGSMELIRSVVNVRTWREAYYTVLHDIGWAILYNSPEKMLDEVLHTSFDDFCDKYVPGIRKLKHRMLDESQVLYETGSYVILDTRGLEYQGGYSVVWNLENGDERFYAEVGDRKTYFRNFFGDYDVSALARRLGGGGAHPRVGSAPVTDVQKVLAAINQRTLW